MCTTAELVGGVIDNAKLTVLSTVIQRTLKQLADHTTTVIVLGPLPRPRGEQDGIAWEKTAAYHLERAVKKVVEKLEKEHTGVVFKFVPLGRYLTKKQKKRHVIRSECSVWYRADGIHLNEEGYSKIADAEHLPVWIRFGGQCK